MLIFGVNFIFNNYLLTAQIISHLCTLGLVFLSYNLVKKKYSATTAKWILLGLACFPASFYLVSVYTESLFLLLLLLCYWFWQKKAWWPLGLALIALTATRITGIILIPCLMIAHLIQTSQGKWQTLRQKAKQAKFWHPILALATGSLGLIFYMTYLGVNFQQPLLFFQVQDQFGASRQTTLVLWPQVVWRYSRSLISLAQEGQLLNWKGFIYLQEFLLSCLAFLILLWQFLTLKIWVPIYQKLQLTKLANQAKSVLPLEVVLFGLGAYLLPTLTGNFSSMPRYLLLCPALFIGFGLLKSRSLKIILLVISSAILTINLLLFTQGWWVA